MSSLDEFLMPEVVKGIRAGHLDAIAAARRAGTKLLVMLDGKPTEITPDEAEQMIRSTDTQDLYQRS